MNVCFEQFHISQLYQLCIWKASMFSKRLRNKNENELTLLNWIKEQSSWRLCFWQFHVLQLYYKWINFFYFVFSKRQIVTTHLNFSNQKKYEKTMFILYNWKFIC